MSSSAQQRQLSQNSPASKLGSLPHMLAGNLNQKYKKKGRWGRHGPNPRTKLVSPVSSLFGSLGKRYNTGMLG